MAGMHASMPSHEAPAAELQMSKVCPFLSGGSHVDLAAESVISPSIKVSRYGPLQSPMLSSSAPNPNANSASADLVSLAAKVPLSSASMGDLVAAMREVVRV